MDHLDPCALSTRLRLLITKHRNMCYDMSRWRPQIQNCPPTELAEHRWPPGLCQLSTGAHMSPCVHRSPLNVHRKGRSTTPLNRATPRGRGVVHRPREPTSSRSAPVPRASIRACVSGRARNVRGRHSASSGYPRGVMPQGMPVGPVEDFVTARRVLDPRHSEERHRSLDLASGHSGCTRVAARR